MLIMRERCSVSIDIVLNKEKRTLICCVYTYRNITPQRTTTRRLHPPVALNPQDVISPPNGKRANALFPGS